MENDLIYREVRNEFYNVLLKDFGEICDNEVIPKNGNNAIWIARELNNNNQSEFIVTIDVNDIDLFNELLIKYEARKLGNNEIDLRKFRLEYDDRSSKSEQAFTDFR